MQQLQMAFTELQVKKKRQRELNARYRDALASSTQLTEVEDQLKTLRAKRQTILIGIREGMSKELEELDTLKVDIKNQQQLLSDAALTMYAKGEKVEVEDEYHNVYNPEFSVKFKKSP